MPPPDKDGGSGNGGGSSGGGGGSGNNNPFNALASWPRNATSPLKRSYVPDPSSGSHTTTTIFREEPPNLSFCTQACLLGLLTDGHALDSKCPNVKLHADFATAANKHVLTASMARKLVLAQLTKNMDKDCECLDKYGRYGRYGVLFRITITGYGYTLVAKSVQHRHRDILEHETAI